MSAIHHIPPSVYDTHCDGPGLLPATQTWSYGKCQRYRFLTEDSSIKPLPPRMDLHGKNVLISGSNSGLGLEAAYIFALWGAKVIMACRNPPSHEMQPTKAMEIIVQRGEGRIEKSQLEWWEVDFASMKSVEELGKRWIDSGMTLDYLCNNAGLSVAKTIKTEDGFELTRSVNYLGHCLLTLLVLPAMKKAEAPRIVNTCSCFHYGGRLDFNSLDFEKEQTRGTSGVLAYCDTKLMHVMWTFELQARLARSKEYRHVIANAVHPGFVGSNIWENPEIKALPWPLPQACAYLVSKMAIPTEQGALCILYGALHPKYGFRPSRLANRKEAPIAVGEGVKEGGHYINRDRAAEARPECYDVLARSRLWQRTLEDIKAKEKGLDAVLPNHLTGLV